MLNIEGSEIAYCSRKGCGFTVPGELGGLVVEHQTHNREVLGSIDTGGTMLCKTH